MLERRERCSNDHRLLSSKQSSIFFFSSRRRHTRFDCDWSSDVCSSDLHPFDTILIEPEEVHPLATSERFERAWSSGELTDEDVAEPFCRPLQPHMIATKDRKSVV